MVVINPSLQPYCTLVTHFTYDNCSYTIPTWHSHGIRSLVCAMRKIDTPAVGGPRLLSWAASPTSIPAFAKLVPAQIRKKPGKPLRVQPQKRNISKAIMPTQKPVNRPSTVDLKKEAGNNASSGPTQNSYPNWRSALQIVIRYTVEWRCVLALTWRRESELLMGQVQLKVGAFNGPPELVPHRTRSFTERVAHSRRGGDLVSFIQFNSPQTNSKHYCTVYFARRCVVLIKRHDVRFTYDVYNLTEPIIIVVDLTKISLRGDYVAM